MGQSGEAGVLFHEAEQMHAHFQPKYPLLYALQGFRYCDLLLAVPERRAWQQTLADKRAQNSNKSLTKALRVVSRRAARTLKWIEDRDHGLLDLALTHFTLSRIALYEAVLSPIGLRPATENSKLNSMFENVVNRLRHAGIVDHLPRSLLNRAWMRFLTGLRTGPQSVQEDLDEAWEIAERGPMRLHMADIHLYRARLFFRETEYPWESPEADLKAARKLIEQCGYWRRKEELKDAERVILKKSV